MARRTALLLLAVVVAAFAAGLGVVVALRGASCPVELSRVQPATPELVAASDLAPEGSVGEQRRPVIDAVEQLGGPFGDLVAGRFYSAGEAVPVLVPFGDDIVMARAGADGGDFRAVDLPDGGVRWARAYDGGPARGGLVGDDFVVLLGGREPTVVALGAEHGDQRSCVAVPVAGEGGNVDTLLTDQAGTDVVVVAGPPAAPVTLSRISPGSGEVRWHRRIAGLAEAGSVTVVGDTAVVSRLGEDPVRLADMAAAGGIGAPMVTAYSLDDGSAAWSYPAAADAASTAALVVGSEPGSGTVLVMTAEPGRTGRSGSSKTTVARLVALDAQGAELWRAPLGHGYWSASLWGTTVVAQGAGRSGGAQLRAFGVSDGRPRWTLDSSTLPSVGKQPRTNFGAAAPVGGEYVVPAPNGLVVVDPESGDVQRLDSRVPVQQVMTAGSHLLVTTQEALFVLDPRAPAG